MPSSIENEYEKTLNYIYNLHGSESMLGLVRIKTALGILDNPQNDYKTIHVAGTNGKGSVTALLSSVLKESKLKVGMYTSPHLVDFRERIQVNGRKISKSNIVRLTEEIKKSGADLTFFEFTTALAFLHFKKKKVDYAVIEVGLGGRLDATNVITPILSIITNVTNDHDEILGSHLDKIAYEKSFVIKKGVPTVTAANDSTYLTIWNKAKGIGSPVTRIKNSIVKLDEDETQTIEIDGRKMKLGLLGDFQLENAEVSYEALKIIREREKKITFKTISKGFENVKWPARFQFIEKKNMILLDGAHNPAAMKSIVSSVKKLGYDRVIPVIGIKKGKNYHEILKEIKSISDFIIFSSSDVNPIDPRDLLNDSKSHGIAIGDVKKAMGFASYMAKDRGLILVTGSIYFVGKVIEEMKLKV